MPEAHQDPRALATIVTRVRVPNNYIGKLLDQGKPSAAAIKLLAIKYALGGPGFVVSERLAAVYGMGWREYSSGLKLLRRRASSTAGRRGGDRSQRNAL